MASFGRFIEIGLKDADSYETLPILPFSKSITFSSADLSLMIRDAPDLLGRILGKVMALLSSQEITPEASHVYSYCGIEDAFRLLQKFWNLGKVVAVPHETDLVPVSISLGLWYDETRAVDPPVCDFRSCQTKKQTTSSTLVPLTSYLGV